MNSINLLGPSHPSYIATTRVVAAVGYARSGKDAFADVLVEEFGYTRFAFADKLRECLFALNPVVDFESGVSVVRLQDVIKEYGWGEYKATRYGREIRELLQRFGTEVGRDLLHENIWVNELDKHSGKIAITDCRFPNEVGKVLDSRGKIVRIVRTGVTAVNTHPSETAIDHLVFPIIENDGTLEEYKEKVRKYATAENL